MVSETMQIQVFFDTQDDLQSHPSCSNISVAVNPCCIDEDRLQSWSEVAQHLVNESDFNFVRMHLLNHCFDNTRLLGNLSTASSQLPQRAMMELKLAYRQSNFYEAAFQNLRTKAQRKLFQFGAVSANTEKSCCNEELSLTQMSIT